MKTAIVRYEDPITLIEHVCSYCHEVTGCHVGPAQVREDGTLARKSHGICPRCSRKYFGALKCVRKSAEAARVAA
jgi:hypothetical protein